jgi:carboxylesterase
MPENLGPTAEFPIRNEANQPFSWPAAQPDQGAVLLVHGFTASPWEMRPLGRILQQAGYAVAAVRLPGHGTSHEDLRRRHYEEWLQAVIEGYELLQTGHRQVFGLGISTGALLLAALAAQQQPAGLILLSPFLRLRHWLAPACGLLQYVQAYQERTLRPELIPFYYRYRPVAGVHQINRLLRRVRRELPQITAPALVVNALGDRTVNVASGRHLFERLGSRPKAYHLYGPEVGHGLASPDQPCWPDLISLVLTFLRHHDATETGRSPSVP